MTRVKRSANTAYSAHDRRDAARVLRTARTLLVGEGDPFPVLEAARRVGVSTNSRAWALANLARDTVGGSRNELQLEKAADFVEGNWSPGESPSPRLTRVPRCRLRATGGRCARPLGHPPNCALDPSPDDLVRSVGTEHVLMAGPPTDATMIVAWETGDVGGNLRVRRDDHDRGLWIDYPSSQKRKCGKPLLLGWPEVRRLVLDLNLELADQRGAPSPKRKK